MAPALRIPRTAGPDSISATPQASSGDPSATGQARVWIIIGVITAAVLIGACAAFFILSFLRRRRIRREELQQARRKDPCLEAKEFSRRRKMTLEHLIEEEELTREAMIRKSRATKSISSSRSGSSQSVALDDFHPADAGYGNVGVKEDWKEFEARLQRENTSSGRVHPLAAALPDAPTPTLLSTTGPRSPGRHPLLSGYATPGFSPPPAAERPSQR